MRPAWMDKIVTNLENSIYDAFKDQDIAENLIKQYPDQPIEELADTMAIGMLKSKSGDLARSLCKNSKLRNTFPALCKEAFKNALISLLDEAKGELTHD